MFHRKKRPLGEVELNLTAMLDMAFQLLAFFILTFKPTPTEGQIDLHMPSANAARVRPTPITESNYNSGLDVLRITLVGDANGSIQTIFLGDREVKRPQDLNQELQTLLGQVDSPFVQVILQVTPNVHYQGLMSVIESCAKTTLADGHSLRKLSFVEVSADRTM